MTRPRALVVRSGANPFASFGEVASVELVQRVSHSIEPVDVPAEAFPAAADLTIFTSQVTVERLFGDSALSPVLRRSVRNGRVVAVGASTAGALRAQGVVPDLVANGSGESLLEKLPRRLEGQRILLPCGEDAAHEIPEGLRARGAHVSRLVVYRKVARPADAELGREIVERPFAAFCTTSPLAARWLFASLAPDASDRLRRTPAVVLGSFTRRYLESHGVERINVTKEARFASAARLLEALATAPADP